TPPGIVGNTNVVVKNPDGQSGALQSTSSSPTPFHYDGTAPSITTPLSPTSGSSLGGTVVTINGAGFLPNARVTFGGTSASGVSVNGAGTVITATTPAHPAGSAGVTVTNVGGGTATASSAFTYTAAAAPTVSGIGSTTSGSSLGGTAITVSGTNFVTGAQVTFGTVSRSVSDAGTSNGSSTVTSNSAGFAPADVGAAVTGTNIPANTTIVTVIDIKTITISANANGTTASGSLTIVRPVKAASAAVLNSTTISVTTPARPAGSFAVTVTNPDGQKATSTATFTFTAAAAPTITGSPSPSSGNPGDQITITGTGFAISRPTPPSTPPNAVADAIISIGTAPCVTGNTSPDSSCVTPASSSPVVRSATSIVGLVPNSPGGAKTVTVTNPDGQTATTTFTYSTPTAAPTIGSVSPNTGGTLGGDSVTLNGSNFAPGAVVTFGGGKASSMAISNSGGTITARTPAGVYGTVDVTVRNPGGQTGTLGDGFTFTPSAQPTISSVSPTSGPPGTHVTITGTNFAHNEPTATPNAAAPAAVTIGGQPLLRNTRSVADGATTNGSATVTSATAAFTSADVGAAVAGLDIPLGSTITAVGSGTSVTLSNSATGTTSSDSLTITQTLVPGATSARGSVPLAPVGTYDVGVLNPDGQGAISSAAYQIPPDATAPTTTASGVANGFAYTFGTYARSPVTVTLTANDNAGGSGVRSISYSATGGQTIALQTVNLTAPANQTSFTINTDGVTTISYYATDVAGNVESTHTAVVELDSTAPAITASATIPSGGGTTAYTSGTLTDQDVTVSFSCTDGGSGLGGAPISASTSASHNAPAGTNPLSVTVTSAGSNQSVAGTCTDQAGNSATTTFSGIDISRTAPTITASATSGGNPYTAGTWTNEPVTVTFACTPLGPTTPISSLTPPQQVAGPVQNGTVTGTCTDTQGNSSSTTFGTASLGIDIDLTPPVATVSATTTNNNNVTVPYIAGTWTDHDVVVTFSCTDGGTVHSDVATTTPPVTVSAEGSTSGVSGNCTDNALNISDTVTFFGSILIDKTPPVCTVAVYPSHLAVTSKLTAVVATVNVTDGLSGTQGFVLDSVVSNHPATASTDITGFTIGTGDTTGNLKATRGRIYTLTYHGVDVAGNASAPCTARVTSP
ncbi:MAG: IPT/TIG domain-containing protein, partial [Acidimicrobiia bacterium]|nr:IPT/TIG domain-containing protein [Acidimicrobiia bacterium]